MQKLRFKKVLKLFLKYAGIPDEEIDKFMKDPKYEGWKRDDLVSLLEERLEDSDLVYTSTIEEMNRLMGGLQTLQSSKKWQGKSVTSIRGGSSKHFSRLIGRRTAINDGTIS
jgi:hypothetical protein